MPSFDGKGPKGLGPMTGGGLGYCILRESEKSNETVAGFAGWDGEPVQDAKWPESLESQKTSSVDAEAEPGGGSRDRARQPQAPLPSATHQTRFPVRRNKRVGRRIGAGCKEQDLRG